MPLKKKSDAATGTPKTSSSPSSKVVYEAPRVSHAVLVTKAFVLLSLLGLFSNVSQLALSPVYGSIPASIWHTTTLMVGGFIGWSVNIRLGMALPVKTESLLPMVAFYVPMVQFFMAGLSDKLGAKWGPFVTEAFTLLPVTIVSVACVADYLEDVRVRGLPGFIAPSAPGLGSCALVVLVKKISQIYLQSYVGRVFLTTRVGLEVLIAACYSVFAPSKLILFAIPAILHTAVLNTNVMTSQSTSMLNSTLVSENWMLLDRRESVTGYVSVIESLEMGFRVMRCDHSLLGGEWVMLQGERVKEPVYGVFAMLEAVRLVETPGKVSDENAKALVVGLGAGTTPSALVSHGIDATVVEIDPVVHEFAIKYFGLKENNPPALVDAVGYTTNLVTEGGHEFDYIIHDVFTGGAEPIPLFTLEFLQGLSALLKPNGVIAINYAGDFSLPAPRMITNTILQIFPTCRFFRESPVPESPAPGEADFTNLVIFCQKSLEPLTFRKATMEDFLQSRARQMFLQPQFEVQAQDLVGDDSSTLMRSNTRVMAEWHQTSAVGHWNIMQTVLPPKVWQLW